MVGVVKNKRIKTEEGVLIVISVKIEELGGCNVALFTIEKLIITRCIVPDI